MLRVLTTNIISNWAGFGVQVLVTFFLTPFILYKLGDSRYGVWALVNGLTGYYGLLDLGFRSGITQHMTRTLAIGDFVQFNRVASTALLALACCGGMVLVACLGVIYFVPVILNIPPELVEETRLCIAVIGASTAIQLAFFPFSAIYAATQRYDVSNAIGIVTRLVSAAAIVASLRSGGGILSLCAATATAEILGYIVRCWIAFRIVPQLIVSPRLATLRVVRPIMSFGIWSVAIEGSRQLIDYSYVIIISLFMSVSAIAPFVLAASLTTYLDRILSSALVAFYPAAATLHARGDRDGLRTLYINGSRFLYLVSISMGAISVTWAPDFFRLWVGQRFVQATGYSSVSQLFQVLVGSVVIAAGPRIGAQVLMGAGRIKQVALLFIAQAMVSLLIGLSLVKYLGLIGIAVAALTGAVSVKTLAQIHVAGRLVDVGWCVYLREVCLRPALFGVASLSTLYWLRASCPPISGWGQLFAFGSCSLAVVVTFVIAIGTRTVERRLLFTKASTLVSRGSIRNLRRGNRDAIVK